MLDITLDFETYWSQDYSLRKMTTREYIMDSRFEVHLLSVVIEDEAPFVLENEEIPGWLASQPWNKICLNAHHMFFDGAILKWRYGYMPRLYQCTMFMAQALEAHKYGSASLYEVSKRMSMVKDTQALDDMKGRPLLSIDRTGAEWKRYKEYAVSDAWQSRQHLKRFRPRIPDKSKVVIDLLCRGYIDARVELDRKVLDQNLAQAKTTRERLLAAAGVTAKSDLTSAAKFAKLLEGQGVNVPMKKSPSTGKQTYAFAKKDLEFVELLSHPKPAVRMLVEARMNAASSLEETRTNRFIELSKIPGSKLNIPIKFSGAHTHRFSGLDSLNLQNLGRDSLLRMSMVAPKGYVWVVVDAAQIEARILAWLAECMVLVKAFARKEDVYAMFASEVFGFPINKKEHPKERFVGKTGILGLGYQTGGKTLFKTLMLGGVENLTIELAQKIVHLYRGSYPEIPALWARCEQFIRAMLAGQYDRIGPIETHGKAEWSLQDGLPVVYPDLQMRMDDEYGQQKPTFYRHRYKTWRGIYGGALTENMVQHLAWTQIVNTMVRMRATNPGWIYQLQVHDELAYLAPVSEAQECYDTLVKFMCKQPEWAGIKMYPVPFDAEGGIAERYGDAK